MWRLSNRSLRRPGDGWTALIIVVLVLALGYFAFDKFVLATETRGWAVSNAVPNESKSVINAKSIAVLPFENLQQRQ